jgi:hypothetical protein
MCCFVSTFFSDKQATGVNVDTLSVCSHPGFKYVKYSGEVIEQHMNFRDDQKTEF